MTSISLQELIPQLEAHLGIEPGFFESLDSDEENDWSFVIKLHALIEAAVSNLLTESLNRSELSDLFTRLDISNKTTGKAAFVKQLGLLKESERKFMSSLSELRNKLVHDVRNVDFDFEKYVSDMNDQKRQQFLKDFNIISTEVTNDIRTLFFHDPRQAVWYSGMAFLGIVYLKIRPSQLH